MSPYRSCAAHTSVENGIAQCKLNSLVNQRDLTALMSDIKKLRADLAAMAEAFASDVAGLISRTEQIVAKYGPKPRKGNGKIH